MRFDDLRRNRTRMQLAVELAAGDWERMYSESIYMRRAHNESWWCCPVIQYPIDPVGGFSSCLLLDYVGVFLVDNTHDLSLHNIHDPLLHDILDLSTYHFTHQLLVALRSWLLMGRSI
jgi:hypothetical protein